jgi:hypothetical protein
MLTGDIVRFAKWDEIEDINNWDSTPKTHLGLLVEYDGLMKTAKVLYGGEIHSIRVQLVEKAGKKDGLK